MNNNWSISTSYTINISPNSSCSIGTYDITYQYFFTLFIKAIHTFIRQNENKIEQFDNDALSNNINLKIILGVEIYNIEIDCADAFDKLPQKDVDWRNSHVDKKNFHNECVVIIEECIGELEELLCD